MAMKESLAHKEQLERAAATFQKEYIMNTNQIQYVHSKDRYLMDMNNPRIKIS